MASITTIVESVGILSSSTLSVGSAAATVRRPRSAPSQQLVQLFPLRAHAADFPWLTSQHLQ